MLSLAGPRFIFVAKPTCALSPLTGHDSRTYPEPALQQVFLTGHPQSQFLLWFPFLPVICCQWLERTVEITEAEDISPSLALSTSCKSSSKISAPVHSPSVSSPNNYLIPYCMDLSCSFAPQYFYFARSATAHLLFQCLIAILYLLRHHGLFIALTPLSYLICPHCI